MKTQLKAEDSEDDVYQPSPEVCDDETPESIDHPCAGTKLSASISEENYMTDNSMSESDSDNTTGSRSNDVAAQYSFKRKKWQCMSYLVSPII